MYTRFIIVMLVAMLAIPVTTLPRPADSSHAPWGEVAVAAKGKKHKKDNAQKRKQPNAPQTTAEPPVVAEPRAPIVTTVTRTIRQPLTLTFTSAGPITIPGVPGDTDGPANPYPATIAVSGFANGAITDVNLTLEDFTHTNSYDIDVLLTTSDGRQALVMSDVGTEDDVVNLDLTLDDEAAAPLSITALHSGTFRPTDADMPSSARDTFTPPAPAPDGNSALSVFDGGNPNGTWQLWVMDNTGGDSGDLGGWALRITAEVDVQVQEQVVSIPDVPAPSGSDAQAPTDQDPVKGKKDKNHKKGKKGKTGRK